MGDEPSFTHRQNNNSKNNNKKRQLPHPCICCGHNHPPPFIPLKKLESLEVDRASTTARALAAVRAKDEAVAGWAEARARTEATERSAKGRVRELEEEATRLRRELGTRADAAQASRSFLERSLAVVAA